MLVALHGVATMREIAEALGRGVAAVEHRRRHLRRIGVLPTAEKS